MLAHRIEDLLPRIGAPALVVRGSRDYIAPQAWVEEVARLLPQGRLAIIEGGGHALNYSKAPELARLVRPFLRG
jgi:pimeloyl-ACP methyl ester carboxylesterase